MQRLAARICLLSALVAPLVCQAEAAECLAHSLAELTAPNVIEPGVAPECDGLCTALFVSDDAPSLPPPATCSTLPWAFPFRSFPIRPVRVPLDPSPTASPPLATTALRHQAALQVFLF